MLIHAHARKHPITVDLFGAEYLFAVHPENPKAFVCEVEDGKAIERLLAISEAYCEYGDKPARELPTRHVPLQPQDGLSATERELGFALKEPSDGLSAEARAFADAEAARLKAEQEEEEDAQRERDEAIAAAARKEAAEAEERAKNAAASGEAAALAAARFVLKDGETVVDLKTMDDAQLRGWAKANGVKGLNSKWAGDVLREKIVAAVSAPTSE
jgi:hypothetical protein